MLEVTPEHWGEWTEFDVSGTAISLPITGVLTGSEFMEPRVPYTFDVLLTLDVSEERIFEVPLRFDGYSDLDPAQPSDFYDVDTAFDLVMVRPVYDETLIPAYNADSTPILEKAASSFFLIGLVVFVILAIGVTVFWLRTQSEEEILADIED